MSNKRAYLALLVCCLSLLTLAAIFLYDLHKSGYSAIKSVTVIDEEPLTAPLNPIADTPDEVEIITIVKSEAVDKTHESKEASFDAFKDKREVDFYTGEKFDFARVAETAGCSYLVSEDSIIITPIGYSDEATFKIEIFYDSRGFINGDSISVGKSDETWIKAYNHQSATDFTTEATAGEKDFIIGFDELDYLWREIRVLTAPEDKVAEIDGLIMAEMASYYCDAELPVEN
ncbi:MAG: hypothetical protein MJ154_02035 [Candidatus Saccharibacteria bacterium]|nr:hypothetical protein [Candidatus Saccharibacteria bacterium]